MRLSGKAREERKYLGYLSDEERRYAGCSADQLSRAVSLRTLVSGVTRHQCFPSQAVLHGVSPFALLVRAR
jgi:hypothetical protein